MTTPVTFPSRTPRLALPLLYVGQTQKEITVNEGILSADFLIDSAIEGVVSTPPASPAIGSMWLVGTAPTGDFAGQADKLAGWSDSGWRFFAPRDGMRIFDLGKSAYRLYQKGWTMALAPAAPSGGTVIDEQARSTLAALTDALKVAGILSMP